MNNEEHSKAPIEPIEPKEPQGPKEPQNSKWFTPDGKPIRVLSTTLGLALLANAMYIPAPAAASSSADEPVLVSWSTEEVKAYFDKNVDWNIPYPEEEPAEQQGSGGTSGGTGGTTVINNYGGYNSGFGWDDVLLYHMLFNSGGHYSSSRWYDNRKAYYTGTRSTYKPRTYPSTTFQNKPVPGSVVPPKTSTTNKGSITRRTTSSKSGGIGGTSSGLGKSKSSSGSRSSGRSGFGG